MPLTAFDDAAVTADAAASCGCGSGADSVSVDPVWAVNWPSFMSTGSGCGCGCNN